MAADTIRTMSQNARRAGLLLSTLSLEKRNAALKAIAESINDHLADIFAANELDLQARCPRAAGRAAFVPTQIFRSKSRARDGWPARFG